MKLEVKAALIFLCCILYAVVPGIFFGENGVMFSLLGLLVVTVSAAFTFVILAISGNL